MRQLGIFHGNVLNKVEDPEETREKLHPAQPITRPRINRGSLEYKPRLLPLHEPDHTHTYI